MLPHPQPPVRPLPFREEEPHEVLNLDVGGEQRDRSVYALHDYNAVIRAVADGRTEYGSCWGPLGAHLLGDGGDVVLVWGFQLKDRWNFALIGRSHQRILRLRVNAALRQFERDAELARIFERYAVP